MIERDISKKLKSLKRKFPVIVLTGPRQSGKTTIVKNVFNKYSYVSLEEPDTRLFAENDPRGFLEQFAGGVIIDEIQRVPVLLSYIQTIVDNSNKTGLFILTGSQNLLLLDNVTQSLAGRAGILKLLPFSISELQNAGYKYSNLDKYIQTGFYPRIYDKNIKPADYYPNYLQTYIERDVRSIKNISDLSAFIRFVQLCAGRTGQILNLTSLANDCGMNVNTIKSWISVLEASYVIYLLYPYYKNIRKRLIKAPKLYFFDCGLVCSLLNITKVSDLRSHFLKGGLFENFIISEIYKFFYNKGVNPNLYYLRDKTGHEIDLVYEKAGKLLMIELKSGKTFSNHFFKDLLFFKNNKVLRNAETIVIYGGNKSQKMSYGNLFSWSDYKEYLRFLISHK